MKKNIMTRFIIFLGLFLPLLSCAVKSPQPLALDPSSQKFLDIVGYIILPIEEKIFREMPTADKILPVLGRVLEDGFN